MAKMTLPLSIATPAVGLAPSSRGGDEVQWFEALAESYPETKIGLIPCADGGTSRFTLAPNGFDDLARSGTQGVVGWGEYTRRRSMRNLVAELGLVGIAADIGAEREPPFAEGACDFALARAVGGKREHAPVWHVGEGDGDVGGDAAGDAPFLSTPSAQDAHGLVLEFDAVVLHVADEADENPVRFHEGPLVRLPVAPAASHAPGWRGVVPAELRAQDWGAGARLRRSFPARNARS